MSAYDNTNKYGRNWCWVGGWQQIPKPVTLIKVRPHNVSDFRLVQIVLPPSPLIFLNKPWLLVYDAQVWIKNGMVFKFIKSNKRSDFVQMSSKIHSFTGCKVVWQSRGLMSIWDYASLRDTNDFEEVSLLLGKQIQRSEWIWVCQHFSTDWTMINMLFHECWSVRPPAWDW
jgi:hypothetical protein